MYDIGWGKIYWPIFLIVISVLFLPAEIYALVTNTANTLSIYCWQELDVTRALEITVHSTAWYLSFAAWLIFVVLITLHIWFRSV